MAVDPGVSSRFCSNLDLGFKIYSMTFNLLGNLWYLSLLMLSIFASAYPLFSLPGLQWVGELASCNPSSMLRFFHLSTPHRFIRTVSKKGHWIPSRRDIVICERLVLIWFYSFTYGLGVLGVSHFVHDRQQARWVATNKKYGHITNMPIQLSSWISMDVHIPLRK